VTRRILLSTLAAVLLAAFAAAAGATLAGGPPRAPRPKSGAAPWPAPRDAMKRARLAGLVPEPAEQLAYHVHSHLDVFVNGAHVRVPAGIGINTHDPRVHHGKLPDGTVGYGGINPACRHPCISPLHTHASYGLLHTETRTRTPNRLGQFFVEWGVRLNRRCVGGYCKPDSIRVYVNGKRYRGDPRRILLANHTEIAVVIGSLPKHIPSEFPPVPL
jgi:hypothetical protein